MSDAPPPGLGVAVLVPCFNEEKSISKVIADFLDVLPGAVVYVYDNASTDGTSQMALEAGAIVRFERRPGKGNVVRRMLADIEADVYVMVDGDDTYDAAAAPKMVAKLRDEQLDMITGIRVTDVADKAYRRGHVLGNQAFTFLHRRLFGAGVGDVFSGYRVMSRRFVKSFPASSTGFEIEAEMTAHALDIGASIGEVPCSYCERGAGSESKLRTYRDGSRILMHSFLYFKELHPFRFFMTIASLLLAGCLVLGIPVIVEYLRTSEVLRVPSALLSVGLGVVAVIAAACAIILDSVARGRREAKRMAYLRHGVPVVLPQ